MPTRRLDENSIRKLKRTGPGNSGSFEITLPIEIIRELGWREKQKLSVTRRGSSVIITDWHK